MHRAEQHLIFFLCAPAAADDEDVESSGERAGCLKSLKHRRQTCKAVSPLPKRIVENPQFTLPHEENT